MNSKTDMELSVSESLLATRVLDGPLMVIVEKNLATYLRIKHIFIDK